MTPQMTEQQFLDALKGTRDTFNWSLLQGFRGNMIRGRMHSDAGVPYEGEMVCPITAVWYARTGEVTELSGAVGLGYNRLGLDDQFATKILLAADDDPARNCPALRARLLDALGLREVS